jgi:hypothetical protein
MSETLIRLLEGTKKPGRCRGCEASIDWYDTLAGKHMPMNAGAVPRKSEQDDQWRVVAYFASSDSHWATCPERQQFSANGRR